MTPEQAFALADPDRPALPARRVRARAGRAARRAADHRGVPHRRGDGLARARRRRRPRLRAAVPARLHREPGRRLAARRSTASRTSCAPAAGSPTSAAGWAPRRCCSRRRSRRSRCRGSDYHDGSVELARKRAADAGVADRVDVRGGVGARPSPAPATTSSPPSTACTTWATRSAPPGTSAPRSPTTAPGWWSSRARATA